MTDREIFSDFDILYGYSRQRMAKDRRNLNRFTSAGRRAETVDYPRSLPYGWGFGMIDEDTGLKPVLNVQRSLVETIVSKTAQTKIRPYFNPINGRFKTQQVCRNTQIAFDEIYVKQQVLLKGSRALREALIFDVGCLWVDDETANIEKIRPWEYIVDPAEFQFGKLSRIIIYRNYYPLTAIKDKLPDKWKSVLERNKSAMEPYWIYFDLAGQKRYEFIASDKIHESKINYSISPVASIFVTYPIKGVFSTSIIDTTYTLQVFIDAITERVHDAVLLSPANTIFVPQGAGLPKASAWNNRAGNIIDYIPPPGTHGPPIIVSTPAPINPQYLELLKFAEEKMYHLEGVSQLSAQSKKPSGLNSGVALQTVEDIESERFQDLLNNYINFLMEVSRIYIEVVPENVTVLPKEFGRTNITWADIKRERVNFSVQASPVSSLSKDPAVKMEQIEKLVSMNFIDRVTAAKYLEMPDLEGAFSIQNASYDYCMKIIDRCVDEGKLDFMDGVDINMLYKEIINMMMKLDTNDEDPEIIDRLKYLLQKVKEKLDTTEQITMEAAQAQQAALNPQPAPESVPTQV